MTNTSRPRTSSVTLAEAHWCLRRQTATVRSGASVSRGTLKCAAASPSTSSRVCSWVFIGNSLWQIRLRARAFDEFSQSRLHRRKREQFAENLDFPAQFFVRNWLDELLGGVRG